MIYLFFLNYWRTLDGSNERMLEHILLFPVGIGIEGVYEHI